MATDDPKKMKVLDISAGGVRAFELKGRDASNFIKQLTEGKGIEFPGGLADVQEKLTKAEMIPAFGNYIDNGASDFVRDMTMAGSSMQDIFEAIHVALSHHVGAVERSITKIRTDAGSTGGLADIEKTREENIVVGWEHRSFHTENPTTKCPGDPYKVGDVLPADVKTEA